MITDEEERAIREKAYIPEHSVRLMTAVSGAEPHYIEGYLCFSRKDWLIIVGYPLEGDRSPAAFESAYTRIVEYFGARRVSVMAPVLPDSLTNSCTDAETDCYYTLDLRSSEPPSRPQRQAARARVELTVERNRRITASHVELSEEFIERAQPPARVAKLLRKMPVFLEQEPSSIVIDAFNRYGELTAFYVVDLTPERFSTYVIGAYSRKHFVKNASDAVFLEMVRLSREAGKDYIHLGLGISPGIRQFKNKWGGVPDTDYHRCELTVGRAGLLDAIMSYLKMIQFRNDV